MAFISKTDPTVLNIKLTNKGRELLSSGNLTFSQYAIGDSEIDYNFIDYVSATTQNYNILKPKDKNPNLISFVCKEDTGVTKYSISTINNSDLLITNTVNNYGLFDIPTRFTNSAILTNLEYVRNGHCSVNLDDLIGTRILNIFKSSTYDGTGEEPQLGDFIMLRLTNPNNGDNDNLNISRENNSPILFYKITSILSGSFAANNLVVEVDRNLPNYSTYVGSLKCRSIIYKKEVNTDYAIDYINDNVFSFVENYNIPTKEVKHWNLSVVHKNEIEGVQANSKKFTSFNSLPYAGFVSYIQNQENNIDKMGIIHYSNESPANTYGEGLFENTASIYLPTIMWHKNSNKKIGVKLTTSGSPLTVSGLSTTYYQLFDENGNNVGKAYNKLKVFTIEDQEMIMAMSYKSNRNWTLPNYSLEVGGNICNSTCIECVVSADITSPEQGRITISNLVSSDEANRNFIIQIKTGNTNIVFTQFTGTTYTIGDLPVGTYDITIYDLTSPMCQLNSSIIISEESTEFNIGSGFNNIVNSIIETTDGGYLVGGRFTSYQGQTANRIIKLKSDGSIDDTFNSGDGFNDIVQTLQQTTDGGYLVGGDFTSYSGQTAKSIIRLYNDGSIDDTFNSGNGFSTLGGATVFSIIQDSGGKYLVGGRFTSYQGQTANRIIKLKSDGSIDDTFNSGDGFNDIVYSIIQDSNGKYLIGGFFTSYKNVASNSGNLLKYLIRLNDNGDYDNTFTVGNGFSNSVNSIIQDNNGKYLIGGSFVTYSGQTANRIIRLYENASIDDSFNIGTGFNETVNVIFQDNDDKYLIGGQFTTYFGQIANYIIKLKSDGSVDDTFNSDNFGHSVYVPYIKSFIQNNGGKYLIGGMFETYSTVNSKYILQLNQDGTSNTTTV